MLGTFEIKQRFLEQLHPSRALPKSQKPVEKAKNKKIYKKCIDEVVDGQVKTKNHCNLTQFEKLFL